MRGHGAGGIKALRADQVVKQVLMASQGPLRRLSALLNALTTRISDSVGQYI